MEVVKVISDLKKKYVYIYVYIHISLDFKSQKSIVYIITVTIFKRKWLST